MQMLNTIVSAILSQSGIAIIEVLKWVLFVPAFVLATAGVVMGLHWESEKFIPPVQKRGKKLLLLSLLVETISGALSIGADGLIGQAQQREIDRTTKQLVQFLEPRSLSKEQKDRLASVAEKFPSLNFQTIAVPENEPWSFVMEIAALLQTKGWNWLPCDGPLPKMLPRDNRPASCWTIVEGIQVDGAKRIEPVVNSLVEALSDPDVIGMDNARPEINEAFPTIVIMVGSKR
jgi:hypothetical protein